MLHAVHSHFQMDIQTRIKEVLNESASGEHNINPQQLNGKDLLNALHQKGVIDDVMKQLQFDSGGGVVSEDGRFPAASKD